MYCSQCGTPSAVDASFCAACGAPIQSPSALTADASSSASPVKRVRPPVVTVLAVLKTVTGLGWLFLGLALLAFSGRASNRAVFLPFGILFVLLGGLALFGGYGLWTLRPQGRYIQMAFSFLGLLVFPLQTIISILILVYMFQPGIRVLFSGTPIESLDPVERKQLLSLQTSSTAAIVVAIVVAIPMGIAIMGILAAIAIPNFLTAVERAKQKRTMADLRSIGVAVESYAADNGSYPTADTAADLQAAVEPRYIKAMPTTDGWGNSFRVSSSGSEYVIYSQGKDGTGNDCTPGQTSRLDDQICFSNRQFTRYPEGFNP